MIKLDITTFIFLYTLFSIIIMLVGWVAFGYRQNGTSYLKDADPVWKCSICSHIYIDSRHDDISECPMCGSYNKKQAVLKSKGVSR